MQEMACVVARILAVGPSAFLVASGALTALGLEFVLDLLRASDFARQELDWTVPVVFLVAGVVLYACGKDAERLREFEREYVEVTRLSPHAIRCRAVGRDTRTAIRVTATVVAALLSVAWSVLLLVRLGR